MLVQEGADPSHADVAYPPCDGKWRASDAAKGAGQVSSELDLGSARGCSFLGCGVVRMGWPDRSLGRRRRLCRPDAPATTAPVLARYLGWYEIGVVLTSQGWRLSLNPHPSEITNTHKSRDGLDRLVYAIGFSISGLRAAYRHEKAFRLEVWLAAVLLPGSFWLGNGWVEITILSGSVMGVMAAELLNSAIEAVVDRISTERHELSGRAKDLGSACVLLMVILTGGIWISALWSRFGH